MASPNYWVDWNIIWLPKSKRNGFVNVQQPLCYMPLLRNSVTVSHHLIGPLNYSWLCWPLIPSFCVRLQSSNSPLCFIYITSKWHHMPDSNCFVNINWFSLHHNKLCTFFFNYVLLFIPFYRWENWVTKSLNNLSKITQLVGGRGQVFNPVSLSYHCIMLPFSVSSASLPLSLPRGWEPSVGLQGPPLTFCASE